MAGRDDRLARRAPERWAAGIVAVLATAAALAAVAAGQEPQAVPTFSTRAELVVVDVLVLDPKGEPVRGLRAEDFLLSEDGKPQTVATFEAFDFGASPATAPAPPAPSSPVGSSVLPPRAEGRPFILLVDDMGIAAARAADVRKALSRFLEAGVRDDDRVVFATTSGDAWWTARMPEGREDLLALVARIRGRSLADDGPDAISEWEAFRIVHFEGIDGGAGFASSGGQGPPPGAPVRTSVPGSSLTDRVVQRYYDRRVCNPDSPPTPPTMCAAMVRAKAVQVDTYRTRRTRDALSAVDRAVFAFTGVRGRKALLLLTEGFLNDPDLDALQEVSGRCREAQIAVYALDVRGLVAGSAGMSASSLGVPNRAEQGLMQTEEIEFQAAGSVGLAEDTGGFAFRNSNDLGGGAVRVADESRAYYLLGYAPPEGKGPRDWRRLKVEVKRPGVTVRARRGYTLRTTTEIALAADKRGAPGRDGKTTPAVPAEVARALSAGRDVEDIPLRAMAYALDTRAGGAVRTIVAVEADTRAFANLGGEERPRVSLIFSTAVTHRDTGKTFRLDQHVDVDAGASKPWTGWLLLSRELELPPGVAQAHVVLRDEFLGRIGALTLRFEVPAAAGLRLSTPLLTERLVRGKAGGAAAPALVAHRRFPPEGQLYCQFQVFGAGGRASSDPVVASFALRRTDGTVVLSGEPTPIAPGPDGGLVRLLALPLEGRAPGSYEIVLRVEDKASGETRERVESFEVTGRSG
jgi:VWFA-related protein